MNKEETYQLNNQLKLAKQKMKNNMLPYKTYMNYLTVPIFIILVYISSFFGVKLSGVSSFPLIFSIIANRNASKLNLLSKKKYLGPILIYLNEIVVLFLLYYFVNDNWENVGLANILALLIQFWAVVFFFITANDMKKKYPRMKEEYEKARREYLKEKQLYKSNIEI